MTFQAFDASLPSVVLAQRNEIEYFSSELPKTVSLTFLEIGQKYNTIKTEVHLHFVAAAYKRIELVYQRDTFPDMRIHDGPGPLSPQVEGMLSAYHRKRIVHLSGYQAYIKYSMIRHGSIYNAYTKAMNHSYVKPSALILDQSRLL